MQRNLFIKLITRTSALFIQTLSTATTSNYHKHILTSSILVYPFVQHLDTSIHRKFATITKIFADVYVYKNIYLLMTTTIALRSTITKRKNWTPPDGRNQFIDSFVNCARTYFDNFVSSISPDTRSNLPTNQQTALKDLSSNNDIVIMEADKRGVITIINKDDYITDCSTLLEDNST